MPEQTLLEIETQNAAWLAHERGVCESDCPYCAEREAGRCFIDPPEEPPY